MAKQLIERLGKDIPPKDLVGKNQKYNILREPSDPAYPNGYEVAYSDDYLSHIINKMHPLELVLGHRKEGISKGKLNDIYHFVMGSPLQNSEGETALGYILLNSAQAGNWQPLIIDVSKLTDTDIKTAKEYLKEIENISPTYNKGKIEAGILFGVSVAKRGGFVFPTKYDNKVIVIPSQEFIEYCSSKN